MVDLLMSRLDDARDNLHSTLSDLMPQSIAVINDLDKFISAYIDFKLNKIEQGKKASSE
jgi:hypothetical protein